MTNYITATFKSRESLEHALTELDKIGVRDSQISLIAKEEAHKSYSKTE